MKRGTGKWDTLEGVLGEVWAMLNQGVGRFSDPFHCPILGSIGDHGCSLRTVILRQLILPDRILVCHTDSRAPKVDEILRTSRVSWLFYHPKRHVQLKIFGKATLHGDDRFADEQWAHCKKTSRLNYCTTEPPGTSIDIPSSGLPESFIDRIPSLLDSAKGRRHFMVIACKIDTIDWLVLRVTGNRRARFDWDGDRMTASWLIP